MPTYEYECLACFERYDAVRPVDSRHKAWCPKCGEVSGKVFTPTANVFIAEHFRHDQSQFLPPADDTAAWEARSKGNMSHAPAKVGADFAEHLERDLRGTWG